MSKVLDWHRPAACLVSLDYNDVNPLRTLYRCVFVCWWNDYQKEKTAVDRPIGFSSVNEWHILSSSISP